RDLREGQHRNPTDRPEWFTTAYFHHPTELREEVEAAGLIFEGMFGIEGPGWLMPGLLTTRTAGSTSSAWLAPSNRSRRCSVSALTSSSWLESAHDRIALVIVSRQRWMVASTPPATTRGPDR